MDRPPVTVVFRDSDTNDTLEATRVKGEIPGGFFVHDIFESEHTNPSIEEATMEAMARVDPPYEQNMAVLFFYTQTVCVMLTPGGVWATPDPAPLELEDIIYIFNRVVEQPWYNRQVLQTRTVDGVIVTVRDGEVLVGGDS